MTSPTDGHAHHHEPFPIPPSPANAGPVNYPLLSELVTAALDGCTTCQDPLITLLAEDPDTTCHLVGIARMTLQDLLGGLPPSLLYRGAFGLIASAGADQADLDAMRSACHQMTATQRREAINTALDLLAGAVTLGENHPQGGHD